jgi:hypothetical protein
VGEHACVGGCGGKMGFMGWVWHGHVVNALREVTCTRWAKACRRTGFDVAVKKISYL